MLTIQSRDRATQEEEVEACWSANFIT